MRNALLKQNRYADAEHYARMAVKLEPENMDSYASLATILRVQGRFDEALENAQKSVELAPKSVFANAVLGDVLMFLGDMAKLRRDC